MSESQNTIQIVTSVLQEMEAEQGESFSLEKVNLGELGRRTGISRGRLRRLKKNGFKFLPHGNSGKRAGSTLMSGFESVTDNLLRHDVVTSSVILKKIQEQGYAEGLTTVKNYIRDHINLVPAKRHTVDPQGNRGHRYTTEPGDCFQMDWGFVKVVDLEGREWQAACFCMVCHHCGLRYVEFFPNAKQENLFIAMLHSFAYMVIPRRILTDNMESVVIKRTGDGLPVWNATYVRFQELVGFGTDLCKPRHPFTKGSGERLVRFVKEIFVIGNSFYNVNDLNAKALQWCEEENSKIQKELGLIPIQEHAGEPFVALEDDWNLYPYIATERNISFDGLVTYEGRRYGVPAAYIAKTCRVKRTGNRLEILDDITYARLAEHIVDWFYKPHYCEEQFDFSSQPEEHPTARVKATMLQIEEPVIDDDFLKFDF